MVKIIEKKWGDKLVIQPIPPKVVGRVTVPAVDVTFVGVGFDSPALHLF